jgi:hypothetical protein
MVKLGVFEVDRIPMKASWLDRSGFETVHQHVDKTAAVGMVTAGVRGDEAEQGRASCFDNGFGIKQVVQDGQR